MLPGRPMPPNPGRPRVEPFLTLVRSNPSPTKQAPAEIGPSPDQAKLLVPATAPQPHQAVVPTSSAWLEEKARQQAERARPLARSNEKRVQPDHDDRARIRAILQAPEAVGREPLALMMAVETNLTAAEAIGALRAAALDCPRVRPQSYIPTES